MLVKAYNVCLQLFQFRPVQSTIDLCQAETAINQLSKGSVSCLEKLSNTMQSEEPVSISFRIPRGGEIAILSISIALSKNVLYLSSFPSGYEHLASRFSNEILGFQPYAIGRKRNHMWNLNLRGAGGAIHTKISVGKESLTTGLDPGT